MLEDSFKQCEPDFEEITNKWFRQTSFAEQDDKSLARKIKHLNKSPFQKVKEIMEVPRELIKKSRQMPSNFKMIGKTTSEHTEDDEIYNDKDLISEYMRTMIT